MPLARRTLLLVALAAAACALALAGCGPSAAQVREARDARYDAERAAVFRQVAEVVAKDHTIRDTDPATAQLITEPRWYEAGGNIEDTETQPNGEDAVILHHGSLQLSYAVGVIGEGRPFQVIVKPVIDQWFAGATSLYRMEPGEPEVPGWIEVRVNELQIAIHQRLRKQLPWSLAPAAPSPPDDD